jgi:hypothetical protein
VFGEGETLGSDTRPLQGGSFDLADRLFSSVAKSWLSASEENRGDVRELIPELYYSPLMLLNLNRHEFGRKQVTEEEVDDVELPPWALGNALLFTHRYREVSLLASFLLVWCLTKFPFARLLSRITFPAIFQNGST